MLVAPCLCSRTPGSSQGQACLMAGTLSRPRRRGQTPTAAGVRSRPPCEFQPCNDRPITWAVRDVKPTWLPTRAQQVWAPARTRCRGERERRGRRSKQASKLCELSPVSTTTTTLSQPHHHYSLDTPPSLYTINLPSLFHRAGISPFPLLWVSVAPRLLSVSPQHQLLCYTPTDTNQPLSINSWAPHISASASLPAAFGLSPCPAATVLSAQGAVEYQRSTARTQTSPREPA